MLLTCKFIIWKNKNIPILEIENEEPSWLSSSIINMLHATNDILLVVYSHERDIVIILY